MRKIVNLKLVKDNKHEKAIQEIHELLKERTPMSHTDEWTKQQLQYSHETMWNFIQCFDLYDEFYEFVVKDCSDLLSKGNYQFFKDRVNQEYIEREFI